MLKHHRQLEKQHHGWKDRPGAATVELAISLPVLLITVFGAIEAANFIHLKQDLLVCAYEAARVAIKTGDTAAEAQAAFDQAAAAKGFQNVEVTFTPELTSDIESGTQIRVVARFRTDDNRLTSQFVDYPNWLRARVFMLKQ